MTLRPRDKAVLGCLAAFAVIVAFYMLVLAPARHTAAGLSASIADAQSALTQDESTASQGKTAAAAVAGHPGEWAALARAVPANANIPQLLRIIEREADAAGVEVQTISLSGSSTASSSSTSSSTPAASGTTSSGQVNAVPVSLTLLGGYHELDQLIGRLDGLVEVSRGRVRASGPLMSIASVALSGSSQKISAQLSASIYQHDAPAASTTGQ